jgi:CxxC motif-containing protein (DUF1111 family)
MLAAVGLATATDAPPPLSPEALTAGPMATTTERSERALMQPVADLSAEGTGMFTLGRNHMRAQWVFYWFEKGEWGAGPTFNASACTECHVNHGRGAPNVGGKAAHAMIVRLSLPGVGEHGGPLPHPAYGDQLQTRGVPGVVPAEGIVELTWEPSTVTLADGTAVELRRPRIAFRDLQFGHLDDTVLTSLRAAPPLVGLGLLDAVPDATLEALAARPAVDGIRGRVNHVHDLAARATRIGRYGHKANTPNLRQQIAAAFFGDIGVSSDLFPEQNCPGPQDVCRIQMAAGKPELGQQRWNAIEHHLRHAAVPARRDIDRPDVRRGEQLFAQAKCAACHLPQLETGNVPGSAALSRQIVRAYTDLLLHDMGEGLADGRPDFEAGPRDWRTAPLWGLGLARTINGETTLLHDGRARSVSEAILWHGGEAAVARDAFRSMDRDARAALVAFVESL